MVVLPLNVWIPRKHLPVISNELQKYNEIHNALIVLLDNYDGAGYCCEQHG